MSDINEARAIRYLIDALNDKPFIEMAINMGLYSPAIFHMEQLCEKSTKACLCTFNILITKEHLFTDFIERIIIPDVGGFKGDFNRYIPILRKLENKYVSSRYGVDQWGNIKVRKYDREEIAALYISSTEYSDLCFNFIEHKLEKQLPRKINELEQYLLVNYREYIE